MSGTDLVPSSGGVPAEGGGPGAQGASGSPVASPGGGYGPEPLPAWQSQEMLRQTDEGNELVSAWRQCPSGFDGALRDTQEGARAIITHVGDTRAQLAFMEGFDRTLTERARYHVYDALRQGGPTFVEPVSNADLAVFGNTAAGRDMIAEWGASAPQKVARVWERFARLREALDDDYDFDSFVDWYSGLPTRSVKAILRQLGG